MVDDRVYERVPLAIEVEYRTAGAFLVSYSSNLSKGGVFLDTPSPAPEGTELTLRFTIPPSEVIEVRGRVKWVRAEAAPGQPAGMGVEFEHLDARHGDVIDGIVSRFRGLRVVVLAKSPMARAFLGRAVRSILASADVVEVTDADAADRIFQEDPDLAVIDLDDTRADGLLTVRLAKNTPRHPMPVIVTARDDETQARARELGADEVVGAPLTLPDLQAAVVRALGRPIRVY
ncbi:MAG TPA: TIGR02266 family protein [Haliangiales bacterium]|nr:TIGR02266 family protein [Haliangiales bacterium]